MVVRGDDRVESCGSDRGNKSRRRIAVRRAGQQPELLKLERSAVDTGGLKHSGGEVRPGENIPDPPERIEVVVLVPGGKPLVFDRAHDIPGEHHDSLLAAH